MQRDRGMESSGEWFGKHVFGHTASKQQLLLICSKRSSYVFRLILLCFPHMVHFLVRNVT